MNVELGKLSDGGLVVMSDAQDATKVKRVEYYREQRLFLLIYETLNNQDELAQHELTDVSSELVETCPTVFVVNQSPDETFYGYDVPLIKVGSCVCTN